MEIFKLIYFPSIVMVMCRLSRKLYLLHFCCFQNKNKRVTLLNIVETKCLFGIIGQICHKYDPYKRIIVGSAQLEVSKGLLSLTLN